MSPKGFSKLWLGPATKASNDIEIPQVTLFMRFPPLGDRLNSHTAPPPVTTAFVTGLVALQKQAHPRGRDEGSSWIRSALWFQPRRHAAPLATPPRCMRMASRCRTIFEASVTLRGRASLQDSIQQPRTFMSKRHIR